MVADGHGTYKKSERLLVYIVFYKEHYWMSEK